MTTSEVYIVRHTYDCFEVVAYDVLGQLIGHRMYRSGSPSLRRKLAIQQAEQWADEHYLYFNGQIQY